jgi:DNA-binding NtrC family response regulator
MSLSIGVITEDPQLGSDLRAVIEKSRHNAVKVESIGEAVRGKLDLLFVEWPEGSRLPAFLVALRESTADEPAVPVVVLVPAGRVTAMRRARAAGAADVLFCPLDPDDILAEIGEVVRAKKVPGHIDRARFLEIAAATLVGESPIFRKCLDDLRSAAAFDANVLLLGETGTGKEMFARAIHALSRRSNEHFVALNLASLPGTLLESELFGHGKGAFTDAKEARVGRFEIAGSGTLLLDEIGDIEPPLQVKLLRVIEKRVFQRVGDNDDRAFKARLICATSVDLDRAASDARFRPDLLACVSQFRIALPPLRERRMDILILSRYFVEKYRRRGHVRISSSAAEALERFDFPMNVRQLQNAIIGALARLGDGAVILPRHLPEEITGEQSQAPRSPRLVVEVPDGLAYEDARNYACQVVDRHFLPDLCRRYNGNSSRAAAEAGVDQTTFAMRLKEVTDLPKEAPHE